MGGKRLTLMIIPHTNSGVREIRLAYRVLWISAVILTLVFGALIFYAVGYYTKVSQKAHLRELEAENTDLIRQIGEINSDVEKLKGKIAELVKHDEMLRVLVDLESIASDTRMVGVGGPSFGEEEEALVLSPRSKGLVEQIRVDIDQLLREAEFEKASFLEIEKKLSENKDILDHTPSIVPTSGYFSSGFGPRRDPFTGRIEMHEGVDIAGRTGTPIYATADGVVKYTGYTKRMGKTLVLDHKYGHKTYYGHFSTITVRKGQKVKRGQKIGEMGNTGRSTGPHLHYGVSYKGKFRDPWNYFYSEHNLDID